MEIFIPKFCLSSAGGTSGVLRSGYVHVARNVTESWEGFSSAIIEN